MACFSPLHAKVFQKEGDKKNTIWFKKTGTKESFLYPDRIPCGQCVGCRLDRSKEWAMRCMHEASLHDENSFITLTYGKSPNTLVKEDVTKFIKRLRKRLDKKGIKVRFYMCGEYGERDDNKNIRKRFEHPHYHIILFGYNFPDKKIWQGEGEHTIYRSKELEKCWKHGFSSIGAVSYESSAYVARYVLKKIVGKGKEQWYKGIQQEYTCMSRKPGIAKKWIEKYGEQVYRRDKVVMNQMELKPARYYDKHYDIVNPERFEKIKKERKKNAERRKSDNTPERLKVREYVTTKNLELKKRKLKGYDLT